MIRAVIFDLDDTLYPHEQFVRGAYRDVAETAANEFGVDAQAFFAAIWPLWVHHGSSYPMIFCNVLKQFGLGAEAHEWALVQAYRAHKPQGLSLHEHVAEGLQALHSRGVKLGVLSNGQPMVQQRKFDLLGLAPLVDAFLCTGTLPHGHAKPHSSGFYEIARLLGVGCDEAIYVGDHPHHDFPQPLTFRIHLRIRQGEASAFDTPKHATAEFANISEALSWLMSTIDTL